MRLEVAKAKRICHDKSCMSDIMKGEICGTTTEESPYGHKGVSYCKPCVIRGLEVKKRIIEAQLKKIRSL